jgi:hypothetical protein
MTPPKDKLGEVARRIAREIHDYGDSRRMRCDNCGHEWTEELPQ